MNLINKVICVVFLLMMTQSCGYIVREIVAPNSCKKCDILLEGSVIETSDECGGGVYNMETKMKARAYDLGPDYYVNCQSYMSESN